MRSLLCRKLMQAYCQKASVALESVAFVFDGNRLRAEQTPDDVDMEDVSTHSVPDVLYMHDMPVLTGYVSAACRTTRFRL
jgi:hypothetical protein